MVQNYYCNHLAYICVVCETRPQLHVSTSLPSKCHHLYKSLAIFTALQYALQAVFLTAKVSVCPSVRLSVTCINCDKTNESSAETLIPSERKIHVVFRTQRMVGGERPLLPEILGQSDPPSFKNGNFHSIFARSGSTVGAVSYTHLTLPTKRIV